jgi:hypothetical protein
MLAIDLRFTLPGFDGIFAVSCVEVASRHAFRGFLVGFGHDGLLLAAETIVEYRGDVGMGRETWGEPVPSEVRGEAMRQLRAIFAAAWAA